MGKNSFQAEFQGEPRHCSRLGADGRAGVSAAEAPGLTLCQEPLLGQDIQVPKPRAVGGLFNNLGEDGGGRRHHFGILTWFPG